MGIFSKIKRGLKKIVKKVGRGIKKVAKGISKVLGKIAKPFQKLGILGQIALSFIMPWAVGGILKGMGYLASPCLANEIRKIIINPVFTPQHNTAETPALSVNMFGC